MDRIIAEAKQKMQRSIEALEKEYASVRTGRASPALLDSIKVDYFGSDLPVNQLATVTTPESRLLVIAPWDKSSVPAIKKAILTSDLGITPQDDGTVIRLQIPSLTEERRQEIAKSVKKKAEGGRIAVRNVRRDAIETIDRRKDGEGWSDDEIEVGKKQVQKITDEFIAKVDKVTETKIAEVMEL